MSHLQSDQLTLGTALRRALGSLGFGAVFGSGLSPLVTMATGAAGGRALAAAYPRVVGRRAAWSDDRGRLHLGSSPGDELLPGGRRSPFQVLTIEGPEDLNAVLEHLSSTPISDGASVCLEVQGDLDEPMGSHRPPTPPPLDRWVEPSDELVELLHRSTCPFVLAGQSVLTEGCIGGLRAMASSAEVGVLNTPAIKGAFDWHSRHHLATVGLQARDLELAALSEADLVVVIGTTPQELLPYRLPDTVVAVAPLTLDALSERWRRPRQALRLPPIRSQLAAVTEQGWKQTLTPIAPSAITRNYSRCLAGRGTIATEPGMAGYWIARTFPTSRTSDIVVPVEKDCEGFSVACCLLAGKIDPTRHTLAVTDGPPGPVTRELLDLSAAHDVPIVLETWDSDGPPLDASSHLERLSSAMTRHESCVMALSHDHRQLSAMDAVAGPVVAWGGIDYRRER